MPAFYSPHTLNEALDRLADSGARPLSGGTDLIPRRLHHNLDGPLVDLSRISEMAQIQDSHEWIELGALLTMRQLTASNMLQQAAPSLVQAAERIGALQTRSRATLGGNIANASPAADTLPPLLIHQAQLVLRSRESQRTLALDQFLLGPGQTALQPGELIHSIRLPRFAPGSRSLFLRLGNRSGMAVSVISTAAVLQINPEGTISLARIALGAAAPTAIRIPEAEAILEGKKLDSALIESAAQEAADCIRPISDVRASASYRRHAAFVLVRRALTSAGEGLS